LYTFKVVGFQNILSASIHNVIGSHKQKASALQSKSEDRPVHTLVGRERVNRSDTFCYCRWRSPFASDIRSKTDGTILCDIYTIIYTL